MSNNINSITGLEFETSKPTVYLVQGSFDYAGRRINFWYESDTRDISDSWEFTDSDGDYIHDLPEAVEDAVCSQAAKEVRKMIEAAR